MANLSEDVTWDIIRGNNAYLVKRRSGGGAQFSRDPFSLTNKHSRMHSGLANHKAIGLHAKEGGGASLSTKRCHADHSHKPASHHQTAHYNAGTPSRKTYRSITEKTVNQDYRPELRRQLVARASAIHQSQKEKKDSPKTKVRGKRAQDDTAVHRDT